MQTPLPSKPLDLDQSNNSKFHVHLSPSGDVGRPCVIDLKLSVSENSADPSGVTLQNQGRTKNAALASVLPKNTRSKESSEDNYLMNCADNLFKIQKFVENVSLEKGVLVTALLPSSFYALAEFRRSWKRLQELFFRKHAARAIGTIERYVRTENENFGMLHAHLLIHFPANKNYEEIFTGIEQEFQSSWRQIVARNGGEMTGTPFTFKNPEDEGIGARFALYIAKAHGRNFLPAKWGKDRNETYLLKAGLVNPKLWERDELPSRKRRSTKKKIPYHKRTIIVRRWSKPTESVQEVLAAI